ncbi:MAG: chaperone required for assembly of F1-ATPase [Alphaproteobacteria bacterium]|jgi:chaperone required for assembly of F1-ATPase
MKRFYKTVSVEAHEAASAFAVMLDQKPVQTPARNPLQVPSTPLAQAIADEWDAQGDEIAVDRMPLTQVAATALDRVAADAAAYARSIAAYGETDLVCYRAASPDVLVARQTEIWQPLVDWVAETFSTPLTITTGVAPIAQPSKTLTAFHDVVSAHTVFEMAALGLATTASGSLVIALALSQGRIDADAAFEAGCLDETWQVEKWGADEEAEVSRQNARTDLNTAERFFELCRKP